MLLLQCLTQKKVKRSQPDRWRLEFWMPCMSHYVCALHLHMSAIVDERRDVEVEIVSIDNI